MSTQLKNYYYGALKYPCPPNLNIWWNIGSLLFLILGVQIVRGLLLRVSYTSDELLAVKRINYIIRDANYGWAIRVVHIGGASIFFALIYMHICRGVYYGSYMKNPHLWYSGVTLYFISIGVAFLEYVLPWGVMSYWGLTVITNILTVIPGDARALVVFQGGFIIGSITLKHVFILHFLLPFLILGLRLVHILLLHEKGSRNPLGLDLRNFRIPFHPYYTRKDLVGFAFGLVALVGLAFTFPKLTADPLQWQIVNKAKTPSVIKPEWYFLYAYAILRSIPHKAAGVSIMFLSVVRVALLPLLRNRSKTQRMVICPIAELVFFIWVANFIFLTIVGGQEPAGVWIIGGQIGTFVHFSYIIIIPLVRLGWESLLFDTQE